MINNLDKIISLCDFSDNNSFYYGVIIKRRKDFGNSVLHVGNVIIKTFTFTSLDSIQKQWPFIKYLANCTQSRVYISLNRKKYETIAHDLLIRLANKIKSKTYHCSNDYDSIVLSTNSENKNTKKWLIDIDSTDNDIITDCINNIKEIGGKIYLLLPTVQGVHLISSTFPITKFIQNDKCECKKDSLVLCYYKFGESDNEEIINTFNSMLDT